MKKNVNLLEGPIFASLIKLAIPIMGTSVIQMAYNLVDMMWIGRIGSGAVAAVGAAGMYMWLSNGLATLARMGGQIKVAHCLGAGEKKEAVTYAQNAFQLAILLGVIYGVIMAVFNQPLISFFKLNGADVIANAQVYLMIVCGTTVFGFINSVMTGVNTAMGNSKTPFLATTIGLVINLILDPVLIFGIGPIPEMGVAGAACATVIAQVIVTCIFIVSVRKDTLIFDKIKLFSKMQGGHLKAMIKISLPVSIQNMILTGISMTLARIVAAWGDAPVAVQKVGSQIESISWMIAEGFASAMNAFMGQNYGAGNMKRVRRGFRTGLISIIVWGIFTTSVLIFLPGPIFSLFIREADVVPLGIEYLQIIGVCQIFMCVEIMVSGVFSGLGKTLPPAIVGVVFTASRIPIALVLSATVLGLSGIWWTLTITCILKGIVLLIWYLCSYKRIEAARLQDVAA